MLFTIRQHPQKRKQSRARSEASDLSDIEIVDRLLRGKPGAFDLFYRRYERVIYHCIRRRADAADVDDIFQSFFLERLMESDYRVLRLWQRGSSLPNYLSKVIRNFVIDFQRKKYGWSKWEIPGELPETPVPGGQETRIFIKQFRRLALRQWGKLDSRDGLLICWKFHRELTNEAMAERLNLTRGALRTALSRAQERFLASLKALAPEYFPA